ncbi:MAG: hypothetical protein IPO24_12950 [Bacteroidetes bacterium]|nr:hypothetical protein [Bacteroidota bacterium]
MKNQIQQFLSIAALIIIPTYLTAQDPDIIWQKTVGGAEDDILHQVRHTADGGAILGGTSFVKYKLRQNGQYYRRCCWV